MTKHRNAKYWIMPSTAVKLLVVSPKAEFEFSVTTWVRYSKEHMHSTLGDSHVIQSVLHFSQPAQLRRRQLLDK